MTTKNYQIYGSDEQEKVETLLLQKQDILDMVDIATAQEIAVRKKQLKKRRKIEDVSLNRDEKASLIKSEKAPEENNDSSIPKKTQEENFNKEDKKGSLLIPLIIGLILLSALALTFWPQISSLLNINNPNNNVTETENNTTDLNSDTIDNNGIIYTGKSISKLPDPGSDVWTTDTAFSYADAINENIVSYYNNFYELSQAKSNGDNVSIALEDLEKSIETDIAMLESYSDLYLTYEMDNYHQIALARYYNFQNMLKDLSDSMSSVDFNSRANEYIEHDADLLARMKFALTQALDYYGYDVEDYGDHISYTKRPDAPEVNPQQTNDENKD